MFLPFGAIGVSEFLVRGALFLLALFRVLIGIGFCIPPLPVPIPPGGALGSSFFFLSKSARRVPLRSAISSSGEKGRCLGA